MGDEDVGADDAVPADHRAAAKDRRAGVNGHIVLDSGVALLSPQALSAPGGQRAKRHALIDLHVVADDRGLAHHNAGAVVNKEIPADGGAGVDVDARDAVGVLRHDPGEHGDFQHIQHVRQPVHRDGKQSGVAEDDLVRAERSGVTVVKCLHVCLSHRPDAGNCPEELQTQFLRRFLRFPLRPVDPQGDSDLLVQIVHHVLNEHGEVVLGVVDAVGFVPGGAGVDNAQKLADHVNDHGLVPVLEWVKLVDVPAVAVILQNAVHNAFDFLFDGGHRYPSLCS